MSAIPLGKGAFQRIGAPEMRLVNLFYEQSPTNQEDQVSLIQRPGLVAFAACGAGPVRGVFRQEGTLGGLIFVVSGTSLYKVDPATGAAAQISGTIPGEDRVSMAGGGVAQYVLIANGTGLYKTTATTLSTVTMPGGAGVSAVAYIANHFLAAVTDTQKFFYTEPGGVTFGALDFLSTEFAPDGLRCIAPLADFVHFIGRDTTEIWVPTGNPETPFQRLKGRLFNVGCADRSTVVRLDNTLFWVGNDRIVYRLGNAPMRISDHGIDERLAAATDLRAWACVHEGHGFYVLSTGTETLVYDVTTQQWSEFQSYGLGAFRCHLGVQLDGAAIGADREDGRLWRLDPGANRDDGEPLVREFTGAFDVSDALARCDRVLLDCTVGSAALEDDPLISMRVSDDWRTWSDWREAALGRQGEFGRRVAWTRLGIVRRPGRLFHWRTDADCKVTVRKARMNERL